MTSSAQTQATGDRPEPIEEDPVLASDPSVRQRRRERIGVGLARVALAVAVLGSWQLVSGRLLSAFWISSPAATWSAVLRLWEDGQLADAVKATLLETVLGFVIGSAAGVLVGIALGVSRLVARTLEPYLVAVNSLPRVALIPLIILWFGIGLESKVIFSALLVFFPVFMNTLAGARDVDRDLVDGVRVMGASRREITQKVLVPACLVWVFAGLRMSVPFALIGAVIAEMFTSNRGLGYLISLSANNFDTSATFAALFVTTVLGLVLTAVVGHIERRLLRWQRTSR